MPISQIEMLIHSVDMTPPKYLCLFHKCQQQYFDSVSFNPRWHKVRRNLFVCNHQHIKKMSVCVWAMSDVEKTLLNKTRRLWTCWRQRWEEGDLFALLSILHFKVPVDTPLLFTPLQNVVWLLDLNRGPSKL